MEICEFGYARLVQRQVWDSQILPYVVCCDQQCSRWGAGSPLCILWSNTSFARSVYFIVSLAFIWEMCDPLHGKPNHPQVVLIGHRESSFLKMSCGFPCSFAIKKASAKNVPWCAVGLKVTTFQSPSWSDWCNVTHRCTNCTLHQWLI